MGILIGLSVAAGAIFLGWLFLKFKARGATSAAAGGPGGIFGGIENYATTGLAMAAHGLSYGQTTSTAIGGLANQAVDTAVDSLNQGVNIGGKVAGGVEGVALKVAGTAGGVIKTAAIDIPRAAAAPIVAGVKTATTEAIGAVGDAGKAVGSAVGSAYNAIKFW